MNIKMRYLTAIVAGMLMTTGIVASEKMYAVGVGVLSCGKIVANIKDDQSIALFSFSWAQGYLSGLNANHGEADGTDLSDYEAHKLWIENYCEENPLDLYAQAALNLWHELRDRQGLEPDLLFQLKDQP